MAAWRNPDVRIALGWVCVIGLLGWMCIITYTKAKAVQDEQARARPVVDQPNIPITKQAGDYLAADVKPTDRSLDDVLERVYRVEIFGRAILDRAEHDKDVRLIVKENPGLEWGNLHKFRTISIPIAHRLFAHPGAIQAQYDAAYGEYHGAQARLAPSPGQTTRPKI